MRLFILLGLLWANLIFANDYLVDESQLVNLYELWQDEKIIILDEDNKVIDDFRGYAHLSNIPELIEYSKSCEGEVLETRVNYYKSNKKLKIVAFKSGSRILFKNANIVKSFDHIYVDATYFVESFFYRFPVYNQVHIDNYKPKEFGFNIFGFLNDESEEKKEVSCSQVTWVDGTYLNKNEFQSFLNDGSTEQIQLEMNSFEYLSKQIPMVEISLFGEKVYGDNKTKISIRNILNKNLDKLEKDVEVIINCKGCNKSTEERLSLNFQDVIQREVAQRKENALRITNLKNKLKELNPNRIKKIESEIINLYGPNVFKENDKNEEIESILLYAIEEEQDLYNERNKEKIKQEELKQKIAPFKKQCEELGFKPDTDKFKDCIVELM